MPRSAMPVALLEAYGRTHLSKAQIQERREQELKVPFTDVKPPDYLNEEQKEKFTDIANKLLALKVMTELDVDSLARYVIAQDLFLVYSAALAEQAGCMSALNINKLKDLQGLQDKAFKQAQSAARELGLSITSRAKIVVPKAPEGDDEL